MQYVFLEERSLSMLRHYVLLRQYPHIVNKALRQLLQNSVVLPSQCRGPFRAQSMCIAGLVRTYNYNTTSSDYGAIYAAPFSTVPPSKTRAANFQTITHHLIRYDRYQYIQILSMPFFVCFFSFFLLLYFPFSSLLSIFPCFSGIFIFIFTES